jgi:hypothetical protein
VNEVLYDVHTGVIAVALLVAMVAAIEAGFRYGRRHSHEANDATRTHVNTIQASTLGILALLLGFTFSLALQRHDGRSEAVVAEANAIGTAWLRSQLLPPAVRDEVRTLMRRYLDVRVQASDLSVVQGPERQRLLVEAGKLQDALWAQARRAAELDPNPVTSGLFIPALNDLIDSYGRRDASLDRHVPELVLLLLFATFLLTGSTVGYGAGLAGHRPSLASHVLVLLIVVLVFIILDLDRPRRGFIEVSQKSLIDLQATMRPEAARP